MINKELLEACKRLIGSLHVMVMDGDNCDDIIFARAAIARAESAVSEPDIAPLIAEEMRYYHDGHYMDSSDAKYQLMSFAERVKRLYTTPPAAAVSEPVVTK
jgi:hypothetical protein